MKRKITSMLLLVCMIFTMLPIAVSAAGETPVLEVAATVKPTAIPVVDVDLTDTEVDVDANAGYTVASMTWQYYDSANALQSASAGDAALPNTVYVATVTFAPKSGYAFNATGVSNKVTVSGGAVSNLTVDGSGNAVLTINYTRTDKWPGSANADSVKTNISTGFTNINTVTGNESESGAYAVVDGTSITIDETTFPDYEYAAVKITSNTAAPTKASDWKKDGVITGLTPNTKYRLYIRESETGTNYAGGVSFIDFTTQRTAQNVDWPDRVEMAINSELNLGNIIKGGTGTITITPNASDLTTLNATWDRTKKTIKSSGSVGSITVDIVAAGSTTVAKKVDTLIVDIVPRTTDNKTIKVTQADTTYGTPLANFTVSKGSLDVTLSSITYSGENGFYQSATRIEDIVKPTDAGKYTLTVIYAGTSVTYTATDDFEIKKKDISGATVVLANQTHRYDGTPKTQVVDNVILAGSSLTSGVDYEISDNSNIATEAGTYTLTISAIENSNYTGSVTAKYTINRLYIAGDVQFDEPTATEGGYKYSVEYDGEKQEPNVKIVVPSGTLEIDKDYTVVYSNNVNAGRAYVTVDMTPECNYAFTQPVTMYFTIEKAPVDFDTTIASEVFTNTVTRNKTVNLKTIATELFGAGATVSNVTRTDNNGLAGLTSINENNGVITYTTKSVATASTLATYTFVVKSTNYVDTTMTLNINAVSVLDADVKLTGIPNDPADPVVYGDANFTVTAKATVPGSGTGTWTWSVTGTALKIVSGANTNAPTFKVSDVGTSTITVTYVSGKNDATDTVTETITVGKGVITLSAKDYNIAAGAALPTLSLNDLVIEGLAEGDNLQRKPTKITYADAKIDTNKKDVYEIIVSQDAIAPNTTQYDAIVYKPGHLVIGAEAAKDSVLYFNTNGGSTISRIVKSAEFTIDLTKSEYKPTREGYTFAGWYSDSTLTNKITSVTVAKNKEVTVYAKWDAVKKAVLNFNTNGGNVIDSITKNAEFTTDLTKAEYKPTRTGFDFAGWYKDSAFTATSKVESIKVELGKTVTLYAKWTATGKAVLNFNSNGGTAFEAITKDGEHLTVDVSKDSYRPTREGYEFKGWFKDADFKTPAVSLKIEKGSEVTVYAKWEKKTADTPVTPPATEFKNPFNDVVKNDATWYYADVMYVAEKGLMSGTATDTFSPEAATNRAMLVTVLHRMAGTPNTIVASKFTDVPAGEWYANAVTWAAANGIVTGKSADAFAPLANITREEMVTILYRYAKYANVDVSNTKELTNFSDVANISDYAVEAFEWAVAEGIITGSGDLIAPKASATRAQIAAILHRFDVIVNK